MGKWEGDVKCFLHCHCHLPGSLFSLCASRGYGLRGRVAREKGRRAARRRRSILPVEGQLLLLHYVQLSSTLGKAKAGRPHCGNRGAHICRWRPRLGYTSTVIRNARCLIFTVSRKEASAPSENGESTTRRPRHRRDMPTAPKAGVAAATRQLP